MDLEHEPTPSSSFDSTGQAPISQDYNSSYSVIEHASEYEVKSHLGLVTETTVTTSSHYEVHFETHPSAGEFGKPRVQESDLADVYWEVDGVDQLKEDGSTKELGCRHYKRKCKYFCERCHRFYPCRICHDEIVGKMGPMCAHEFDRFSTKWMLCGECHSVSKIGKNCGNCQAELARYYCDTCHFHYDNPNDSVYHCDDCGLCRKGQGLDIDYYHCKECACCLPIHMKQGHRHCENMTKRACHICCDDLFASRQRVACPPCGHAIHSSCLEECIRRGLFTCAFCRKLLVQRETYDAAFDRLVQNQPMPEQYANHTARVLCNECGAVSDCCLHFVAMRCGKCGTYNTRKIS